MNKRNCLWRVGLGLLLLLPVNMAGAQGGGGIGGGVPDDGSSQPVNMDYPGMIFSGSGSVDDGPRGNTIRHTLMLTGRLKYLTKSINAHLDKATLSDALNALAQASGMIVTAPVNILDTNKRLTIEARNVPMGTVLEAIAQQMEVIIAPQDTVGITLKPWPSLNINGHKSQYRGSNAPWSDEWLELHPPENIAQGGGGGFGGFGGGGSGSGGGLGGAFGGGQRIDPASGGTSSGRRGSAPNGLQGAGGGMGTPPPRPEPGVSIPKAENRSSNPFASMSYGPGASGAYNSAPLSMTVSGDRLAVAEPTTGPKGEPGYQLTVYNIAGGQMKIVSSVFHASVSRIAHRSLQFQYNWNSLHKDKGSSIYTAPKGSGGGGM